MPNTIGDAFGFAYALRKAVAGCFRFGQTVTISSHPCEGVMTYVITYAAIDRETTFECETATEALAVATRLRGLGVKSLAVGHVKTGNVAIELLTILAEYEKPKIADDG